MPFDKSAIEAVVAQSSKELATKAVGNAVTAKLLIDNKQVTPGVKGKARINKLNTSVNFQSGSGCGSRSAVGDVVLTDNYVTVTPIKDIQNICVDALYDTYYASLIAKGQDPESESLDASFISGIMDFRATKIAETNEDLMWQGDTDLTGSNNLKYIDGFLKQINVASDKISVAQKNATYTKQLQAFYKSIPAKVRKQADFRIFIGEDVYDEYLIELDAANKFRQDSAMTLTGTSAQFQVTPGLNGKGKAVAAMISDLHLGIDGMSDADQATLKYSMETEQWYADFHFAVGVAIVNSDQIGIMSIGDYVEPIASASLVSSSVSATGATLTWSAADGATSYKVQSAKDENFTTNLVDQYSGALLTKAVTGLSASTQYWFRVQTIVYDTVSDWKVITVTTTA